MMFNSLIVFVCLQHTADLMMIIYSISFRTVKLLSFGRFSSCVFTVVLVYKFIALTEETLVIKIMCNAEPTNKVRFEANYANINKKKLFTVP